MPQIIVEIPIGGAWPSAEELSARNAVIDELDAFAIGSCTGAGGGRGAMDFSYRVAEEASARVTIEQVMQRHMPHSKYVIRVSE